MSDIKMEVGRWDGVKITTPPGRPDYAAWGLDLVRYGTAAVSDPTDLSANKVMEELDRLSLEILCDTADQHIASRCAAVERLLINNGSISAATPRHWTPPILPMGVDRQVHSEMRKVLDAVDAEIIKVCGLGPALLERPPSEKTVTQLAALQRYTSTVGATLLRQLMAAQEGRDL